MFQANNFTLAVRASSSAICWSLTLQQRILCQRRQPWWLRGCQASRHRGPETHQRSDQSWGNRTNVYKRMNMRSWPGEKSLQPLKIWIRLSCCFSQKPRRRCLTLEFQYMYLDQIQCRGAARTTREAFANGPSNTRRINMGCHISRSGLGTLSCCWSLAYIHQVTQDPSVFLVVTLAQTSEM